MDKSKLKEALDIMRRTLEVEYLMIVHYPRLARMMPDGELASKANMLGQASIRHASIVSNTISELGGVPPLSPDVEPLPEPLDLKETFRKQLEFEKLALWLHTEAANRVEERFAPSLRQIAEEEKQHIKLVEEIVSQLG